MIDVCCENKKLKPTQHINYNWFDIKTQAKKAFCRQESITNLLTNIAEMVPKISK